MILYNDFFKKGLKYECLVFVGFSKILYGFKNDIE